MACDAQTLINTAYANGYAKLSDRDLRECILAAACAGGGGGAGGSQMVLYTTTDPTTDGVTPTDQTKNAIAYKADGTGSIFVWDPVGHAWH